MYHTIVELREWVMLLLEAGILWVVYLEYQYDFRKDLEKKHRKTKTTKKTTGVSGETVEESTEITEPIDMASNNVERGYGSDKREGKDSSRKES